MGVCRYDVVDVFHGWGWESRPLKAFGQPSKSYALATGSYLDANPRADLITGSLLYFQDSNAPVSLNLGHHHQFFYFW